MEVVAAVAVGCVQPRRGGGTRPPPATPQPPAQREAGQLLPAPAEREDAGARAGRPGEQVGQLLEAGADEARHAEHLSPGHAQADAAQAPGQLADGIAGLGADYWVGNLHKWVCAPKASAVLYVAPPWRERLRPLVASHGLRAGYQPAFDWTGTRDPTPLLSVPAALDFFDGIGWAAVRSHNNDLARAGAELVAGQIGTSAPDLGGLAAARRLVRLPAALAEQEARTLEFRLLREHAVVVPVTSHGGWRWLRVSAQLYNTLADYERLAVALR